MEQSVVLSDKLLELRYAKPCYCGSKQGTRLFSRSFIKEGRQSSLKSVLNDEKEKCQGISKNNIRNVKEGRGLLRQVFWS